MSNQGNGKNKSSEEELDKKMNTETNLEKIKTPKSKLKKLKTLDELLKERCWCIRYARWGSAVTPTYALMGTAHPTVSAGTGDWSLELFSRSVETRYERKQHNDYP